MANSVELVGRGSFKHKQMKKQKLHNPKKTLGFRKELRKRLTPAEAFLWTQLSRSQFKGRKFRKQHGVGPFIVDFYCASEALVIELDGQVHFNTEAQANDARRTRFLESKGLRVIRFENKMVFDLLPSVLKEIEGCFKENHVGDGS